MKNRFQIGEIAKLFGITHDTLRYYDKIGLLNPTDESESGYRYYSIRDIFKLSRILFLKELDIPLKELKVYMENKSAKALEEIFKKKNEELDEKIHKLISLKNKINSKLEIIGEAKREAHKVLLKSFPKRSGVFLDLESPEEDIKRFFKNKRKYMERSSWLREGQIYTSVSKKDLQDKRYGKFQYFSEIEGIDSEDLDVSFFESGLYACLSFHGSYENIGEFYDYILNWIEANNLEIRGASLEKNIVDYDFSDFEEEFISEIQIPVMLKI